MGTKIFNKSHPKFRPVKFKVYKNDEKTPIMEGATSIRTDSSINFSFDVSAFFNEDAEFGTVAVYTVKVEQWKSLKEK